MNINSVQASSFKVTTIFDIFLCICFLFLPQLWPYVSCCGWALKSSQIITTVTDEWTYKHAQTVCIDEHAHARVHTRFHAASFLPSYAWLRISAPDTLSLSSHLVRTINFWSLTPLGGLGGTEVRTDDSERQVQRQRVEKKSGKERKIKNDRGRNDPPISSEGRWGLQSRKKKHLF